MKERRLKKWTIEEIKELVEGEEGNGCKLLSTVYEHNKAKLKFLCACGNEFETKWNHFISRSKKQCNACSKQTKWTFDTVKDFIENKSKSKCKLLSKEYITCMEDLEVQCFCGEVFQVSFNRFYSKNKRCCNACSNLKRRNYDEIKEIIESQSDCKLISKEYKGAVSPLLLKCACGNEFETKLNAFMSSDKKQCNACGREKMAKLYRISYEEFLERLNNKFENEYEVVSDYKALGEQLKLKHKICGTIFRTTGKSFLKTNGCPTCGETKGEKKVREYLTKNNYNFDSQHSFESLRGVRNGVLKFDFSVMDEENKLLFLIEYDGEYHYYPVFDEQDFRYQKLNDKRKDDFCEKHNIPLIRIPYWEFDFIDAILDEEIEKATEGAKARC